MTWFVHDPATRFLAQIIVILAASRALALVATRLGQPTVIAEIAAGIMLGPSLLGWLAPDASSALFAPGSLDGIRQLSQLGLVLFMFLVGLELDLGLLQGRRRVTLLISKGSILLPFGLGLALAFQLHDRHGGDGTSLTAFALFMGAAMSITAFPVLARILGEANLMRTRLGTTAIACAALNDLVAWCLLAFAVSVSRSGTVGDAVTTTVWAAGFAVVMLAGVRPVLAWAAARFLTPGTVSQHQLALVVVLLLVSAWATERIGIHALFGAFLFGVILPKHKGLAQAITAKVEDLVMIVFLPLFFAISGLRTQVDLLGSTEHLLVCLLIIAAASVGKIGGGALAARVGGLPWREAGALGVLLNTRGLMELIALNLGLELGVITPELFSMMVVMALVTTLMTMPLLRLLHPVPVPAAASPPDAAASAPDIAAS